jgi:hypothetical protein
MKPGSDKSAPEKDSDNGSSSPVNDSADLIKYARAYFSADFPNHARIACPPEEALDAVVRSGGLPEGKLLSHLFGCSECLKSYQRLRAFYWKAAPADKLSFLDRVMAAIRLRPLTAVASMLIVTCAIGFLLWLNYGREASSNLARNAPGPSASPVFVPTEEASKNATGSEPETSSSPAEQKREAPGLGTRRNNERPSREIVAANTVRVDLEAYALLRDGDAANRVSPLSLSPARTRFVVTLLTNSPRGVYKISVLDPFGRELMSKNAVSANGKTLSTELDMRSLSANKYRLCVSRLEEAPDCYPFTVVGK